MIINGGARKSGGFFARHLMKAQDNERVEIKEMRGLYAEDLPEAFREMQFLAAGTKAENYFYHVNVNPREDEHLTPEQWQETADTLERNLGLENHPRVIVEHSKNGRTHQHIIWSRVDMDTNTVTPVKGNYYIHAQTARELEQAFHLSSVPLPPAPERDRFKDWETFRAQESGISPAQMKAEITALWQQSDGGRAFQAAVEEKGYLLAKGDRRDFILIDPTGDIHSLARRIDGAKAADIRAKMGDLDRDSLMSAKEASAWMQAKEGEAENSGSSDARILPEEQAQQVTSQPPTVHNPKLAVLEKYATHQSELRHATAQEFTDQQEALLARQGWQLPYSGTQTVDDWLQRGYDSLEEQHAAIPDREHHHPPERDAAPPHKQPQESWTEFIERTTEPRRTEEKEREPEIEL